MEKESYNYGEEAIDSLKKRGEINNSFNSKYFLLIITGIIITPYAFPELTKFIVGSSPNSKEFKSEFSKILKLVAKAMESA